MNDALKGYGELGLGSRLKRLSELMMREIQLVYNHFNIDFDTYFFPVFKTIANNKQITNSLIKDKLQLTQPAVTQAINKLKKKGLIDINIDKIDKRKKLIVLSDKGEQLLHKVTPIWQVIDDVVKDLTQFQSHSLIHHINHVESMLHKTSLSTTIIDKLKDHIKGDVEIVHYNSKYSEDFYKLNIEWLQTFFYVEPYDEEVLSKPNQYIIDKGGHIFFAKLNDEVVGTVALMPTSASGIFELTKMAVSPEHRGHKIGQQLMQYCITFAKNNNLDGLVLYSSTILENAIYIYRKYGFVEIPVEANCPYKRSNIKMELIFD